MSYISFSREESTLGYNVTYDDWDKLRHITCSFTGHRPQFFPFKFNEDAAEFKALRQRLRDEIEAAVQDDYSIFLSGGALGVDTWAAQEVLEFRERHYPFIRLEMVLPCIGQDSKWAKDQKAVYADLLERADCVTRTSIMPYSDGCMKVRNELLVRRSSRLIALWNGRPSGTGQTVAMARRQGLDVRLVDV